MPDEVQVWEGDGVVPPEIKALVDEIERLKKENGRLTAAVLSRDQDLDDAAKTIVDLKYQLAKKRGGYTLDDPLYPRYDDDPVTSDGYFVRDIDGRTHRRTL